MATMQGGSAWLAASANYFKVRLMPKTRSITNTTQAWEFLKPSLRGSWWRVEANFPVGLPDAFGFYRRHTHWIEIKVGKDRIRPGQEIMADAARDEQVAIWQACISRDGFLQWRQHGVQCLPPPFFISRN